MSLLSTSSSTSTEKGIAKISSSSSSSSLSSLSLSSFDARAAILGKLLRMPFMQHGHKLFMHGRGYEGSYEDPTCTWRSNERPRENHEHPDKPWLTASEYCDKEATLNSKIKQLAQLIRLSKKTVLYTGAGISASVVGQAARSGQNTVGWKISRPDRKFVMPTFTHYALSAMVRANMIHSWIQQNHDGLPQKAGCPQEFMNECHGSWFDPSNPVVRYKGNIQERDYARLQDDTETADLVLVLGTSLSGLNADQIATEAAERSCEGRALRDGRIICGTGTLGTVAINLQQTPEDGKMTLRMFARSDDAMRLLLAELGMPDPMLPMLAISSSSSKQLKQKRPYENEVIDLTHIDDADIGTSSSVASIAGELKSSLGPSSCSMSMPLHKRLKNANNSNSGVKDEIEVTPLLWPSDSRILVPYDADGRRLTGYLSEQEIQVEARIMARSGGASKGAKAKKDDQWMWLDLRDGAAIKLHKNHNCVKAKQPAYMHITNGFGHVVKRDEDRTSIVVDIQGTEMCLGLWWLDAASRGSVPQLPLVNREPEFANRPI